MDTDATRTRSAKCAGVNKMDNIREATEETARERRRTVKDLDTDDQPREKALKHGCGVLSTADLWALVLRTGLPGKPITELARELMRNNDGSLHRLERRTRREILDMKGIGMTKAIQIEAVMELIRRYCGETHVGNPIIRSSADAAAVMRPEIANLPMEQIWCVLLNRRNEVVKKVKLTSGSSTASIFDRKAVVKAALLENAECVILYHNHPSGNLQPSREDDNITRLLAEACKSMDLRLHDHIILSVTGYYSYADQGRLPR